MAAARHDMRDVELVERDDAPGVDLLDVAAARAGGDDAARPGHGPFPQRRTLAAVVLLLAGLVVGDATSGVRARAAMAALADLPGVAAPLDVPPVELWRGDPTLRPVLGEAGGHLVGVMAARGAADVVGLDPATGAVAWRTVVRGPGPGGSGGRVRCVVPDQPGEPGEPGVHDPPRAPLVVCVVDRAARRGPGRSVDAFPEDRLLTLDARTGAVVADRTVERSTVVAALDADVVTGHVDADGYVHVARTDPLWGRVRWSFVTPHPLPRPPLPWATRISVQDGVVVVDEADGWVLSGDGEVLHSWTGGSPAPLQGTTHVVGDGRYLTRPQVGGVPWPRSHVTDLSTGRSFLVDGRPLPAWPDDGTLDDGVLVRAAGAEGLVAHDPSGAARWRAEGGGHGPAVVIGGRVLTVGSQGLSARDGRTGHVVWTAPFTRTARTSLVTDGRLAVVTRLDRADGVVLSAYGLDDGRPRWTVDLADDISAVAAFGDRLFGWTGDRLVALGRSAG